MTAACFFHVTAEPMQNAQLLHTSPPAALSVPHQILGISLDQLLGKFISGSLPSMNFKCKATSRNSIMQRIWSREKRNFSAEVWLLAARFQNELPEGVNICYNTLRGVSDPDSIVWC